MHCDEVITFWLLVTLFEKYEVREVFTNNLRGSLDHLSKLDSMIEEKLPEIWDHFQELGIQANMFA